MTARRAGQKRFVLVQFGCDMLKAEREARGWTQEDLAAEIRKQPDCARCSATTLSKWERKADGAPDHPYMLALEAIFEKPYRTWFRIERTEVPRP